MIACEFFAISSLVIHDIKNYFLGYLSVKYLFKPFVCFFVVVVGFFGVIFSLTYGRCLQILDLRT